MPALCCCPWHRGSCHHPIYLSIYPSLNQREEPTTAPSLRGSAGRAPALLTLPPGSTKDLTSAIPCPLPPPQLRQPGEAWPRRGWQEDPSLCCRLKNSFNSDGGMDDTGFLQVQHTVEDFSFFSPPIKEVFWRQSLRQFLLTHEGDGNGREETGAVLMGRRVMREGCSTAARQRCRLCCIPRVQVL